MANIEASEAEKLKELESRFLSGLALKDGGKLDDAEDVFRQILIEEARLAEPRMELARILLDTDRLEEAEHHARESLTHLENGGQWVDHLPEHVVCALNHALLAEILRRRADEDDIIYGDPDTFHGLVKESQKHFEKAHSLDPSDEYTNYYAFYMGLGSDGLPENDHVAEE